MTGLMPAFFILRRFFMTQYNSILKWVGGKRRLLPEIEARMPESFNRYFEPFVGGGALFFNLNPENAVINDLNGELINFYKQLQSNPVELAKTVAELEEAYNHSADQEKFYYDRREEFNKNILGDLGLYDAALMLYLNQSGFNGVYKVNKKGYFNISWNHKPNVNLKVDQIIPVSKTLQNVDILSGDFEKACEAAKTGDFVYFDSPYYETWDCYQANSFSLEDHKRLVSLYRDLTDRGVYCMLSNSDTKFIRELYQGYNIDSVSIVYTPGRGKSKYKRCEVIITNYERVDNQLSFDL